jgi:hypothetical protein
MELNPEIPEYDLDIRSEEITATKRKLGTWPPTPPEPSAVDRLAATVDPRAAERVAEIEAERAGAASMIQDMKNLHDLRWAPDAPEEEWDAASP